MRKCLGRCKEGHGTVVEWDGVTLPVNAVCGKGAHPIVEWATKGNR